MNMKSTARMKTQTSIGGAKTKPSPRSLQKLIAGQPLFAGLSSQHIRLLGELAMEVHFEAGERIFQPGDPANRFYLILNGRIELGLQSKNGRLIQIVTFGPGDTLGWAWLIEPYRFYASAETVEPTNAIFFYGTRLQQLCEDDHEFGYQIMKRVEKVIVKNLMLSQQRLVECVAGNASDQPDK